MYARRQTYGEKTYGRDTLKIEVNFQGEGRCKSKDRGRNCWWKKTQLKYRAQKYLWVMGWKGRPSEKIGGDVQLNINEDKNKEWRGKSRLKILGCAIIGRVGCYALWVKTMAYMNLDKKCVYAVGEGVGGGVDYKSEDKGRSFSRKNSHIRRRVALQWLCFLDSPVSSIYMELTSKGIGRKG